ncbi:MAG: signal recognition particle receptor subunit alpha, partial [Alphaproteobacteria bacterium]|nr:signal recognition particle receptor subunit alpha [Alphaproteobacteria bacterium]
MFNTLADRLGKIFDKLKSRGILTADMVDESLREIKIALLEADVALPVVKTFMQSVKEKAVGQDVIKAVQPAQQVVKIVSDVLVETLGTDGTNLVYAPHAPTVIMLVGLQGSGKTTSVAKLALRLKKEGKTVLMASLDIYRPAA